MQKSKVDNSVKIKELEDKVKLHNQQVTNLKAGIFDLIEDKSRVQNQIAELQLKVEDYGKKILEQQRVLEGTRKVLKENQEALKREQDGNN
jgi:flagellar biosynthesis chaperone FliJ